MAISQTEVQSEAIELSAKAFNTFCNDISGMFGEETGCTRQEVCEGQTVEALEKRFEKITAVNIIKSEGALDGTFLLLFDRDGLFTLSGVMVKLPKRKILENRKSGTDQKAEEMKDVVGEVGNILVGAWDRIFREELKGHNRFMRTNTFIGKPWLKSEETIGLTKDQEVIFIPYEMTIGSYPAFTCGVIFPKTLFTNGEQAAAAKKEAKPEAKEEPKAEAKEDSEAEAKEESKAEAQEEPKEEAKEEPKEEPEAAAEVKEEPEPETEEEPKEEAKEEPEAAAKPVADVEEESEVEAAEEPITEAQEEPKEEPEAEEEAKAQAAEVKEESKAEAQEEPKEEAEEDSEAEEKAKEELEEKAEEEPEAEASEEPTTEAKEESSEDSVAEVVDDTPDGTVEKEAAETDETTETEEQPVSKTIQQMVQSPAALPGDLVADAELFLQISAKDIMQKDLVWGSAGDSVETSLTKMQQGDTGYLMVGTGGVLEGIVSKSNITGAISPYLRPVFAKWRRPLDDATLQIKIKWIMSRPVHTISPETSLATIMDNMSQFSGRCLPVVGQDGKVQGLVTVFDIFGALLKGDSAGKVPQAPPLQQDLLPT